MLTGHAYVLQGGGGDDTFNIVHEFMSKKLVRSSEKLDVTNPKCISVIPTEQQVRDAIADIVWQKEKTPNEYTYIFGLLDYAGLKDIEKYYMDIHLKRCISEEKHWLSGFESKSIGIDLDRVADFFGTNVWETLTDKGKVVRSLVGKTWMK